jgi:hypothetical protein
MRAPTRIARRMSAVQTLAASPYRVALASSMASSSSLNATTLTTGPKISSWNAAEVGSTSTSTVGG